MAKAVNLQNLVKHIVNGTLAENLCRICLLPLNDLYEDIFTNICKENNEYCVADVLNTVCQIKISHVDNYRVCANCFISASEAYKFYLLTQRSNQILEFYVNELENHVNSIDYPENMSVDSLCIPLPVITVDTDYDFDISKFPFKSVLHEKPIVNGGNGTTDGGVDCVKSEDIDEGNIVIVMDDGVPTFFKPQRDGSLLTLDGEKDLSIDFDNEPERKMMKKRKRKREPMEYKICSRCPVRYRFVRKLKEHMKEEHGVDLFVCKICQAIIEDEQEYNNHLQTHTGIHTCAICNMVFKKRNTIIKHFKWHEEMKTKSQSDGLHICEYCGLMLVSEDDLKDHKEKKHVKKYTCYYCGKMYKGELSFETHIKKHEANNDSNRNAVKVKQETKKKRKYTCPTCNRDFVDERALLWHERLHTNERPYVCEVCGRGFVSLNRRNQHSVCAHTAPARRCPLCPALFHLRSMVNTHVKKVHLKTHKRRNRTSKYQKVFWKTERVPIQELSVSIQNELFELQSTQNQPVLAKKW
ncbi:zinc finger protein 354C-like isoform X1 [Danaus plexippus]|uniref:zinc finger protein 354C-like isoform X1 n=1 Tax=Danaus plexippus TaxID=13037 RepID=UPI002AB1919C|nr:zinc finger protein 354C-like isoform X1 [Danaus plexippus]XP_061380990.1 zinc finger protein 354C-like isoform X1 [Danaus plexippus]XP_061380991.1 zinc finger protein 354C-like isoform X1 [Danaus plexippus]